jgi:isopropylmalate/homocitrate/citramalate synthase
MVIKLVDYSNSPLYEANPHSLDELFSRLKSNSIKHMPKEILPKPLSERVKELRTQRSQFFKLEALHAITRANAKTSKTSVTKQMIIEKIKQNPLEF